MLLLTGSETNEFSSNFSAVLAVYNEYIRIVSFFYLFDGIQVRINDGNRIKWSSKLRARLLLNCTTRSPIINNCADEKMRETVEKRLSKSKENICK